MNIKKNICTVIIVSLFILLSYVEKSFAGTVKMTIINESDTLSAIKYIIKYGTKEQVNPDNYPYIVEVTPGLPVVGQTNVDIDLGDNKSGYYYFSVKDVYSNGEKSDFSESSFPMYIPQKPENLKIK